MQEIKSKKSGASGNKYGASGKFFKLPGAEFCVRVGQISLQLFCDHSYCPFVLLEEILPIPEDMEKVWRLGLMKK